MNEVGYSPKNLAFDEAARKKLLSGISKLSQAVKSTLGPSGQTVLIESQNHTGGLTVTKDGVTVAKSIDLLDPIENLAVKIMKQAADKTALDAGDGTTTSIVLAESLVKLINEHLNDNHLGPEGEHIPLNKTILLNYIQKYVDEYVQYLSKSATKITKGKLKDVATISANNDKELGKIIADAYNKVGKNGIVTVEKSLNENTYSEVTEGFKLDRGYNSPLFITDQEKDECIFEDTHVLVCDAQIDSVLQIEQVLKPIVGQQQKLLIIAPTSPNFLNTIAANVVKNKVRMCVIEPPSFGYKQHELMQDIALSLGATYYSEKTGDDLSLIQEADLGFAKKIIVGRSTTVVVKDAENPNQNEINERVEQLWKQHKAATKKADKVFLESRIASLVGGIGVIYAGGATDIEQKEKFDRIEDAVCAVKAALESGVLPGGGIALKHYRMSIQGNIAEKITEEEAAASDILSHALYEPFKQICENAGLDWKEVDKKDLTNQKVNMIQVSVPKYGYNVKTQEHGDMMEMGIVDPAKVTTSALINATSVALTICSTNAIVTLARTYESE